jgi:hypothetical protein
MRDGAASAVIKTGDCIKWSTAACLAGSATAITAFGLGCLINGSSHDDDNSDTPKKPSAQEEPEIEFSGDIVEPNKPPKPPKPSAPSAPADQEQEIAVEDDIPVTAALEGEGVYQPEATTADAETGVRADNATPAENEAREQKPQSWYSWLTG